MKKLLIVNELALFNGFVLQTDFTNNIKMLEKLSENGICLALVSTSPKETLLQITRKRNVDIIRLFRSIYCVSRVYHLNDYLESTISWGKRKKISLDEMVYFGCSLHPDYSATIVGERIDFIGVLISQDLGDPFAGRTSMTADQKTYSKDLWQFLPKYLELKEV